MKGLSLKMTETYYIDEGVDNARLIECKGVRGECKETYLFFESGNGLRILLLLFSNRVHMCFVGTGFENGRGSCIDGVVDRASKVKCVYI